MQKQKLIQRQCQPCTACCDGWVRMMIDDKAVFPGQPCQYSSQSGCCIYDRRPDDPCRQFVCGWALADSPMPDWLRPDLGKMMVLPAILQWQGVAVDLAIPVGKRIPPRSLNWIKQFAQTQMRPLLYMEQDIGTKELKISQELVAFGPPEFQAEISQRMDAGEKLW